MFYNLKELLEYMPSFCLMKDKQCLNTFKWADINGIKMMIYNLYHWVEYDKDFMLQMYGKPNILKINLYSIC